MRFNKYKVFIGILIFFKAYGFAQTFYPKDSSYLKVLSNADKINGNDFYPHLSDTIISNFQNYSPRNTSGNIGLPSFPLFLNYQVKELGFNLYQTPYSNDMISDGQVKYFKTKGPYANLTGIAGSKQEQVFNLLFSNTFKNKLNLTLGFNRYSSLGFYRRQQSFTNNFFTSSNYTSKNNRVGYYAYFSFNKLKHQENGGISNDTFFIQNVSINKQLLPYFLTDARSENRFSSAEFNPWLRINKKQDSSTLFSHYIDYQVKFSGNYLKYVDNNISNDKFYTLTYLDTLKTLDSTHWRKLSNKLAYVLQFNKLNASLKLSAKNEINQVFQKQDSVFLNNSVETGFYINQSNFSGNLQAAYIFEGANQSDHSIQLNTQLITAKSIHLFKSKIAYQLNIQSEKRQADYIYNRWYSNHFIWNNQFTQTQKTQAQFSIVAMNQNFKIGGIVQQLNNQVYFDEQGMAQQTLLPITNTSVFIQKNTLLFKHLGINAQYNYQLSSYSAIISMPKHIINGALFFQSFIKKSMLLQVGFNVQYFSEFSGYGYMPSLNSFHVSPDSKVGNYPFVDFFINARIKPVRFFVKIDHVTQGLLGTNYSLAPGYIQNDRAFKFGINWLFFD